MSFSWCHNCLSVTCGTHTSGVGAGEKTQGPDFSGSVSAPVLLSARARTRTHALYSGVASTGPTATRGQRRVKTANRQPPQEAGRGCTDFPPRPPSRLPRSWNSLSSKPGVLRKPYHEGGREDSEKKPISARQATRASPSQLWALPEHHYLWPAMGLRSYDFNPEN